KKSIRRPALPVSPPVALKRGVNICRLRQVIESAAGEHRYFSYLVTGFLHTRDAQGAAIAYKVRPSPPLLAFRDELTRTLARSAGIRIPENEAPQDKSWSIPIVSGLTEGEYEE